jgi:hypothetical protein
MMASDDKVAFYLRHRTLIEEWAALRLQAGTELEEALRRAVGIIGQRQGSPQIVEDHSAGRNAVHGISLQIPDVESGAARVALGWTRGQLLKPGAESWPYMGIRIPGAVKGNTSYDTAKHLSRDAASRLRWSQSSGNWAWYAYLPFAGDETDLDAYAVGQVEALVGTWQALDSELNGR